MRLPAWDAAYEEVRGHIALAEGDGGEATRRFTAAARGFAAAGQAWERERCTELIDGRR